jgi:adenylate cyclase
LDDDVTTEGLRLRLLGGAEVLRGGTPVTGFYSSKAQALLFYLAVAGRHRAGSAHARPALAGLLWADVPEPNALTSLRQALANLRKLVGGHLHITRQAVAFDRDSPYWLDVEAFEAGLAGAANAADKFDPAAAAAALERLRDAVDLYRGDFLAGFFVRDAPLFEEWMLAQQAQLRAAALDALHSLSNRYARRSDYANGITYTGRLLELEPWYEGAHRRMMLLLAGSGQRSAALAHYGTCRQTLEQELGVAPSAETTALYEQIRTEEGETVTAPAWPARNSEIPPRPPAFLDEALQPRARPRPAFVKRERTLARMSRCLEAALGGQSQVLLLSGEAGSGKTALLQEFARRAQNDHGELIVAAGACNPFSGVGGPYLPFRDVLSMLTGDVKHRWLAGAVTREQARRLWTLLPLAVQALLDHGPSLIDLLVQGAGLLSRATATFPRDAESLTRLRALVEHAARDHSEFDQSHIFEQYANVLRALAEEHPLLLLLDDVQWADGASCGLLFHLGRRLTAAGSRILIVSAYRPDEVPLGRPKTSAGRGERHPLHKVLAEFKRHFGDIQVDLAQVQVQEGRGFVDAYLDSPANPLAPNRLSEAFREALFQRTRGHPLFTVELLRAMQERGDLVQDAEGSWIEGPALHWERLPARVEAVIEARVGRLDPALRDLLALASVEGDTFTAQVLAQVHGIPERELLRMLSQELVTRHHLVQESGEVQIAGTDRFLSRYSFTHALFQEYLYSRLSVGERRLLHGEIASVLEALYGEQTTEILAPLGYHYDRANKRRQAAHWYKLAGLKAASQYANGSALTYLGRALDLTPAVDQVERYALLLAREKVHYSQGRREAQSQDLAELKNLAAALADDRRQAEVALRQALYAAVTADYPATIAAAQVTIDLAQTSEAADLAAAAHLEWGRTLRRQGDFTGARAQLGQALAAAQSAQARRAEADSLRNLGIVAREQGDYAGARAYYEQALHVSRAIGASRSEGLVLNSLGRVSRELGNYAEARTQGEQALRIFREIGARHNEGLVCVNLGTVSREEGDSDGARAYYEQALHTSRETGARHSEAFVLANLGSLSNEQDDHTRARAYCEQAVRISRDIGARDSEASALTGLGHALLELGQLTQAAAAFQQAAVLQQESGQRFAIEPKAGLARAALARGRATQAQAQVEELLECLENRDLDSEKDVPLHVYLICYYVLHCNDDPRANEIIHRAYLLLQDRAARIDNDELRRSFLQNAQVHRAIVAEWETLSRSP